MDTEARFERIERTLEFIVQNAAKTDARLDTVASRLDTISIKLDSVASELETTVRVQAGLQDLVEVLMVSQRQTEVKMRETGEKLGALIHVVDGLVRRPPTN